MQSFLAKLDKFFKISERGSTVKTEIVAGLTTFFAMAYIVVTNPNQVVGFMNFDPIVGGVYAPIWNAVYVASILVAVVGTLLYAFYAKMPFAQACGMGLNSFFFVAFIVPSMASTMGLYLMKQFMESSVPDTVLESARLDGASEFRTFLTIAMPMVKPAWLTLIIECFKSLWNSGASNYIHSEELKTFNYAIQQIVSGGIARSGAGAAATVVMMIVPILVFVLSQSQIIETMGSSGMKD